MVCAGFTQTLSHVGDADAADKSMCVRGDVMANVTETGAAFEGTVT